MGQQTGGQERLFYSFNLDDHIPLNHMLRAIDRHLDLSELRDHLADAYSSTGRPSVDPQLMLRMLVVGYCYGIRSERRLCEEVHLNLAYRWFCRLGLEDAVPDHSTFSKNRHGRFRESGTFRWLFERVVRQCMAEGLVKGKGFAVDASIVAADASRHPAVKPDQAIEWPDKSEASRAVKEYLAGLDEEAAVQPANRTLSLTDPQSRLTGATGEPSFFAYSTNYLIDTAHGVIVDVEATPAHRTMEVESTKIMVERVEERFHLKPERLIGDTAYGTASMLGWMVDEKGIEPHVRVWDRTGRQDGTLSSQDFEWHEAIDEYRCPDGKPLRCDWRKLERTHITKADTIIYRSRAADCANCPLKALCCPNTASRKIHRSIHEKAREMARRVAETAAYRQSCFERKKVEMLFAHLKRILRLDRLRLRGLSGATDEFTLAAVAQNLRRLAKLATPTLPEYGRGASAVAKMA